MEGGWKKEFNNIWTKVGGINQRLETYAEREVWIDIIP
jgi:hypothetical protein